MRIAATVGERACNTIQVNVIDDWAGLRIEIAYLRFRIRTRIGSGPGGAACFEAFLSSQSG